LAEFCYAPDKEDLEDYHFPAAIRAAGIIWIVVGSLALASMILEIVLHVVVLSKGLVCFDVGFFGASALFGIAFLVCGIQTVCGSTRDPLGNGVGSLFFGLMSMARAVFAGIGMAEGEGVEALIFLFLTLVGGLGGFSLVAAGILAFVGREPYRQWR
jgi:hypothetical protein